MARRLGANPKRAVLEVSGGQSPQHLITEFSAAIAAGRSTAVLIVGSEAISTTRLWAGKPDAPDFTETVGGQLEDRGYGLEGLVDPYLMDNGLLGTPSSYALFENARRHRLGLPRADCARQIGTLFEPFTRVAAANPYAAAPGERSAEELMTITERNRLIADPYPRFVVARDQVNQGAAVLLTSVSAAQAARVPSEKWVFLHGYCDLRERELMQRPELSTSPSSILAARTALERAELTVHDIATFDLYSCFAIPVFNICDGLGLSYTDPRGLTLTGGLPFFGGAGNNYSMHAVAETVAACRENPGAPGFVGANGGVMSKYTAAVYSTTPRSFVAHDDAAIQSGIDALPGVITTPYPSGDATLETYTVVPQRDDSQLGILVGRLDDGTRTLATTQVPDDVAALLGDDPFGSTFTVVTDGRRNTASALGR